MAKKPLGLFGGIMVRQSNEGPIIVSVLCIAYNHKKYIRNAIESILNQEVKFRYEVLIHDDASEDGTPLVIQEYANNNGIYAILQTENVYSKGVDIIQDILLPQANGKYIALLEGDDYWMDNQKLQKQVDFLEEHLEYNSCVTNYMTLDCCSGSFQVHSGRKSKELSLLDNLIWDRTCFHLCTLMCRKESFYRPDYFRMSGVVDYPEAVWLTLNGKMWYLSEKTAVYRYNVDGSWTNRQTAEGLKLGMIKFADDALLFLYGISGLYEGDLNREILIGISYWKYLKINLDNSYNLVDREYWKIVYLIGGIRNVIITLFKICKWKIKKILGEKQK